MADPSKIKDVMDAYISDAMARADVAKPNRFVVTGGHRDRPIHLSSRHEAEQYLRAMIYEGFRCKMVVQRAWLKVVLVMVFWEGDEGEPELLGLPETASAWHGFSVG